MSKKLIALDLDGTLLTSQGTISDYTKKVLKEVQNQGHQIVIATGRPYRMAADYYRQLQLQTPMINFNGALTHIPNQKWIKEKNVRINKEYLFRLLEQEKTIKADFIAGEYRRKFFITPDYLNSVDPRLFGVEKITEKMILIPSRITEDPNAILMQTRVDDKYQLAEELKKHYNGEIEINTWGGPLNILEVTPRGVNKAFALKHLLTSLNITPDNLIAFGDEHNDTEMLSLAHTGVAMKNASEILLPFADAQTDYDNDHDGVARELEKRFL